MVFLEMCVLAVIWKYRDEISGLFKPKEKEWEYVPFAGMNHGRPKANLRIVK